MNAEDVEKQLTKEFKLEKYQGEDRIVWAEDKRKEIEEERKHKPQFIAETGIATLDRTVEGFRKKQLVIMSGAPKHGKTSFCQTLTKRFIAAQHKCLWFSYELGYEDLFSKFPMDKLDFFVPNYMESGNLEWVEERIIEAKQKRNIDVVFIDHLDFLRDPDVLRGVSLNLSAYVGSVVQRVKSIAVKNDVLIFLMSHIRKNKWTSKDLPSSEELRDSGQIAQLADIVLMIMRPRAEKDAEEVYQGTNAILGVIENRHNGRTKKINLLLSNNEFIEIDDFLQSNAAEKETWD